MFLIGDKADLPVLNIGLLEVNLAEKSVQVDDKIYFKAKVGTLDLLIFFQENGYKVERDSFQELHRRYRLGEAGGLLPPSKNPTKLASTLVSIRNREIVRYGLIIICEKGIYSLKKLDPAFCFNSTKEHPDWIYRSEKYKLDVFKFRDGIEFKDFSKKSMHLSSFYNYGGRVNKNITYIDERGRKYKYYKISELKDLAMNYRVEDTIFIGTIREMMSNKRI